MSLVERVSLDCDQVDRTEYEEFEMISAQAVGNDKALRNAVLDSLFDKKPELYDALYDDSKGKAKGIVNRMFRRCPKGFTAIVVSQAQKALEAKTAELLATVTSGKKVYELKRSRRDKVIYCTCEGWKFRRVCQHLEFAAAVIKAVRTRQIARENAEQVR